MGDGRNEEEGVLHAVSLLHVRSGARLHFDVVALTVDHLKHSFGHLQKDYMSFDDFVMFCYQKPEPVISRLFSIQSYDRLFFVHFQKN